MNIFSSRKLSIEIRNFLEIESFRDSEYSRYSKGNESTRHATNYESKENGQVRVTKSSYKHNENRERSDSGHVNIRDDEEGHLIYVSGDVLQARCNVFKFTQMLLNYFIIVYQICLIFFQIK